jgi:hypothetical protein
MIYRLDPERVLYRYIDGEAVLVNAATSYYYGLNQVGTFVWQMLTERPHTELEILQAIEVEYAHPVDAARPDVRSLLHELKSEGLVIEEA